MGLARKLKEFPNDNDRLTRFIWESRMTVQLGIDLAVHLIRKARRLACINIEPPLETRKHKENHGEISEV